MLGVVPHSGRNRGWGGARTDRIGTLSAAESVCALVPVVPSGKRAEPHARTDERPEAAVIEGKASIDIGVGERTFEVAYGLRIGGDCGRKVFIIEMTAENRAATGIALHKDAPGAVDAEETFARIGTHAVVGQA